MKPIVQLKKIIKLLEELIILLKSLVENNMPYADITPTMTSNSAPSPYVISASGILEAGFEAYKAFDHIIGAPDEDHQGWCGQITGPWWIKLDLGAANAAAVTMYKFLTRNYSVNRFAPKTWTFSGSNNDADWTTLDTKTDQADPGQGAWSPEHSFVNTTAYRYYKFNCTVSYEVGGNLVVVIDELRLYKTAGGGGSSIANIASISGISSIQL